MKSVIALKSSCINGMGCSDTTLRPVNDIFNKLIEVVMKFGGFCYKVCWALESEPF